jgi:hypothetical protein
MSLPSDAITQISGFPVSSEVNAICRRQATTQDARCFQARWSAAGAPPRQSQRHKLLGVTPIRIARNALAGSDWRPRRIPVNGGRVRLGSHVPKARPIRLRDEISNAPARRSLEGDSGSIRRPDGSPVSLCVARQVAHPGDIFVGRMHLEIARGERCPMPTGDHSISNASRPPTKGHRAKTGTSNARHTTTPPSAGKWTSPCCGATAQPPWPRFRSDLAPLHPSPHSEPRLLTVYACARPR